MSEAAFGVVGEGKKAGPRVQSFARAVIYAFFAVTAFEIVSQGSSNSQSGQQELWTAKAMQHPGGRWVVGIVGAVVVVCGLVLVWDGVRRKFRALRELADTSSGPWLLGVVAVGLIMFGVYGFAEAKWRRS